MKGMIKAVQRTPHHLTSRVGMAKKSSDLEFDDMERKFKSIEQATEKLFKDSKVFRDAVLSLLMSGESFGNSFSSLFSPLGAEYDLIGKNPQAEATIKNCGQYAQLMNELRTSLSPELELIDSRVIGPCKDLQDVLKKIRKTITKRDHKLVDYDRHNNSLNKLRDKKEKSLSDEKNLFKVEQDHEAATAEYEHYNGMLKEELPAFLVMGTKFIDPLFHSFYFMQLNIFYMMLEKLQTFTEGRYDLSRTDLDNIYDEQLGDVGSTLEALPVVQRQVSTAKLMAQAGGPGGLGRAGSTAGSSIGRTASTSSYGAGAKAPLGRQTSTSSVGKTMPPPVRGTGGAAVAPPAYTPPPAGSDVGANPAGAKRAPPPPPPLKPKPSYGAAPAVKYVVALFDFEAQAAGDLSFSVGDRIELVERTGSAEDWWTGRVDGRQGVFPGNYVQEE